ncbi:MAG TPA: FRG domain-containing protein [Puia sp.]|uniref:FRG domain-containing protein n=1 Tax=Puia sp. TaxID=2045100 RepID=UPI002BDE61B3|nr:FRG domain-containing protein [Puia sp.]HVU94849.1 FRG domain-containing protein [Puia sp.]
MLVQGAITSLEQFLQIVDAIRLRRVPLGFMGLPMRWEFYRGQADACWAVTPGITRELPDVQAVRNADAAVMSHFRQRMTEMDRLDRLHFWQPPRGFQDDWSLYFQAQHYRIPTRLLDWSGKPEVALFFAVEQPQYDESDGAFYVYYNPPSHLKIDGGAQYQDFAAVPPTDVTGTWFLNPAFDANRDREGTLAEGRRLTQYGKFTLQPYDRCLQGLDKQADIILPYNETMDSDIPVMEKWIIPAPVKAQLRLDLAAREWYGEALYLYEDPFINEIQAECLALRNSFC